MTEIVTLPCSSKTVQCTLSAASCLEDKTFASTGSTNEFGNISPFILNVSPILRNLANRVLKSISISTSSFGSLLQPSTPASDLQDSVENLKDSTIKTPLANRRGSPCRYFIEFTRDKKPKLPFCEGYDGVNMRRTKTISESIIQLLESRWRKGETSIVKKSVSKAAQSDDMASAYFNRLEKLQEMKEKAWDAQTDEVFYSDGEYHDSAYGDISDMCVMDRSLMRSKRSLWANKYKLVQVPVKEYLSLIEDRGIEEATVDLGLRYDCNTESLHVTIYRVEDVTNLRNNNKLIDCEVHLSMYQRKGDQKHKTKTSKRCRDPVFNQVFKIENVIEKWLHVECLHVELYWRKRIGKVRIGQAFIWLEDLDIVCKDSVSVTERFNPCY